jgi:hypothetical protein
LARKEVVIKWVLFGVAAILCCFIQGAAQRFTILGVIPFLFPAMVAVLGMLEGPVPGALFGLIVGIACDLTIPSAIPCFYTLIFPLAGLAAALIAQSWIPAGFPCALIATVLAFIITDGFHGVVLALMGKAAWTAGVLIAGKETAATLPFVIPVYLLMRAVHHKCHLYD